MNPLDRTSAVPLTDYISAVGTVVGILLAVLAIWITRRQRIRAIRTVTKERQTIFELEVLRDLLGVVGTAGFMEAVYIGDRESGRLAMLPDDLPFWRRRIEHDIARISADLDALGIPDDGDLLRRIKTALIADLLPAIKRRVEGRAAT